jgi:Tol biopolymer transport system component
MPLTVGPISFYAPAIDPGGKRVYALGTREDGELVRYDSTIGDFVPYLGGISAIWVDFSRDRKWVAYVRYPDATLWRARADGTDARQLTFAPMVVDGCSWSPDGRQIAFRAWTRDTHKKIYLIGPNGGTPTPLTSEDVEQGIPTWSADGTRLTFGQVPRRFGLAGSEVLLIHDLAHHTSTALPQSEQLWTSRWSPDGRYISALRIGPESLRLFDTVTSTWKAFDVHHIHSPTWSRDSKYIYCHHEGPAPPAVRRIRVADGHVDQITSLNDFSTSVYWWSGLSLDGSPILLRNPVEVYALDLERR